jgi:hypothetical protein
MNSLEKNLRPTPRTLSEAKRDATYAIAVQTFRSDTKLALDFLVDAFYGFVMVGLLVSSIGLLIYSFFGG